MSHIVSVQTEVRDATAVRAACKRLGLAEPVLGTTRLFQGEVNGLAVQFPGWQYPVVADLATGQLKFDDFGGRWGNGRVGDDDFIGMGSSSRLFAKGILNAYHKSPVYHELGRP